MLLRNLRNISVREWKVIWVGIRNMPQLCATLSNFKLCSYSLFSFIVVQMGEEYYYAKDYTKALKWVLFTIYFYKYSDSLEAELAWKSVLKDLLFPYLFLLLLNTISVIFIQVLSAGTVIIRVLGNLTFT